MIDTTPEAIGSYAPVTLLIDDDELTTEVLQQHMLDIGAKQVHRISSGRAALSLMNSMQDAPDLVLCDLFMPDMDGIEFLEQLAKREFKGDVVVISAGDAQMLSMSELIGRAQGLNVLAALRKPVTLQHLKAVLPKPRSFMV